MADDKKVTPQQPTAEAKSESDAEATKVSRVKRVKRVKRVTRVKRVKR